MSGYKNFEKFAIENGVHNGPATLAELEKLYNEHKGSHYKTIGLVRKMAQISKSQYKEDAEWAKKNPSCRRACYVFETRDGFRVELARKSCSPGEMYTGSGIEVDYPELGQKSVLIPKYSLKEVNYDPVSVDLEWEDEKPAHRPRKNPVTLDDQGRETVTATVRQQGNTGGCSVPKDWIGKRVTITLLE